METSRITTRDVHHVDRQLTREIINNPLEGLLPLLFIGVACTLPHSFVKRASPKEIVTKVTDRDHFPRVDESHTTARPENHKQMTSVHLV